ncbi:MAG: phage tail protein [Hyphomicrobium sp.]|nr:MAG: hypothetical protein F9K20_09550 [Hyphomicrobium sp.]MBZ0210183.1 phage tail protein [Hyphomicrobium sp.]
METTFFARLASCFWRYYGKWCIRAIDDDQTMFFADSAPHKVKFDIELVHYG